MKKAPLIICLTVILLTAAACSNLQQHVTPQPESAPQSNAPTLAPIGQQHEAAATLTANVSATVQARTQTQSTNKSTPTPIPIETEPEHTKQPSHSGAPTTYPSTTNRGKPSYTRIDLENPIKEPKEGEWYYIELDEDGLAVEMFMMVTPGDEMLTMYGCSTVKELNLTEALVKIRYHQRLPMELITRETTLPINTFIHGQPIPVEWVSSITQDTDIKLPDADAKDLIKQIKEKNAALYQLALPDQPELDRTIPAKGIAELIDEVELECFKDDSQQEQQLSPPQNPQIPENGMYTYTSPDYGFQFQYPADCGQMWEAPGTADNYPTCTGDPNEINTSVETISLKGASTGLAESPEWFSKDFADNLSERFDNTTRYTIQTHAGHSLEVAEIETVDQFGTATLIAAAFTDSQWNFITIYMTYFSDTSDINQPRAMEAVHSLTIRDP